MGRALRRGAANRGSRLRRGAIVGACLLALATSLLFASSALALRRVSVTFSCTSVTYSFTGFPTGKEDTVTMEVRSDGSVYADEKWTFTGPEATRTLKVGIPAGHHLVKAESRWKTNGVIGESGRHRERLDCAAPEPALSIQKLQEIAGSKAGFTAVPLTGQAGETVDYEILVSNTGNVPLVLSGFSDPKCEAGTLAGGQGSTPLEPGAQTIYTCSRKLIESGTYTNVAYISATDEDGTTIEKESGTVTTTVAAKPHYEVAKLQEIAGSKAGFTSATLTASVGQTVDYEILVKNTGNVGIVFSEFTDVFCDPGTIAGGPGSSAVSPGASSTYTCTRKLTEASTYENVASITGLAVGATGKGETQATNTVYVKVGQAAPTTPGATTGGGGSNTSNSNTSSSGTGTGAKTPAGGGVLSTKSSAKKKHKKKVPHTSSHRTPRFTG